MQNKTKKMDMYVKFCNRDIFRKSVLNMRIRLYNKVPDHIRNGIRSNLLKQN